MDSTMVLHTICQPLLDLGFHPSDGPTTDSHTSRELPLGFELVDHRSTNPRNRTHLSEPENLNPVSAFE